MLTDLHVRDFAIIADLRLQFHPGFNVLTGETGAGKSIIIDAIDLLLGTRASQEMVRAGAENATIEGIFQLQGVTGLTVQEQLRSEGLDAEGDVLILGREVRRGGRSVARINGRAVSQSLLGEIGGRMVDIHGQGQHLSLLNERVHLFLLDRYAGLDEERMQVAALVGRLRQVRHELDSLRQNARELARRVDLLTFQAEEITAAHLIEGEDVALEHERKRLANAETLAGQSSAIYRLLSDGDNETPAALDRLGEVTSRLEKLSRLDPELRSLHDQAEELMERLSDLTRQVGDYSEGIAFDPVRLAEIEERLELIFQLKRKYGDTIAEINAFGAGVQAELAQLAQRETHTATLEQEEEKLLRQIGAAAARLSSARQKAATTLSQAIEHELVDLRMGGTRFQVEIVQQPDPRGCYATGGSDGESARRLAFDATGIDKIQFLVSANPGEPLRPLARVASGGETARLMLALKHVLSQADVTPTLIFDEIDQGIGGRVGAIVGRKLHNLSHDHQVLCVTHLAQIAAYGDHHLAVTKGLEADRTVTHLRALDGLPRVQELAAMLGTTTEAGLQSAQDLLHEVSEYRAVR